MAEMHKQNQGSGNQPGTGGQGGQGRQQGGNQGGQGGTPGAAGMMDKARDVAGNLGSTAREAASAVAEQAQSVMGTVRENIPSAVTDSVRQAGQYLQDHGLGNMTDELSNVVRRNPIPAVLVSIGIGFCLAQLMHPRS